MSTEKKNLPFEALLAELQDEALKVEVLGHALDTLAHISRLVCSLSRGQGFKDLDAKEWGEEVLSGLGSVFEVLALLSFDRKERLSSGLEKLRESHEEELTRARKEALRGLAA